DGPPVLAVEVHGVQPFAHLGGDLGGQLAQPRERQGRGRRGGVRPGRPDVVGGGHGLLLRWMRSGRGRRGPARPAGLPRRQLTIIPTGLVGSECIGGVVPVCDPPCLRAIPAYFLLSWLTNWI